MKRACTIFALALLLTLTGCRGSQQEPTTAATTAPTSEPTQATQPPATDPAFVPQTLVENEHIVFRLTGITQDPIWGYTLNVYLENKTDKNLMFSIENAAVNGFMCDPYWASEVRTGMKANEEISFSHSDFQANGISQVEEIVFTLRVYDSDDWSADDYVNQTVEIRP